MKTPYKKNIDAIMHRGNVYRVNLAYDNVLRMYKMQSEKNLTDEDRMAIAFKMLVIESPRKVSLQDMYEIIAIVHQEHLAIPVRESKDKRKYLDIEKDFIYLYSSFVMDYGIDLIKEKGKLGWFEFMSLLLGLSINTKMREIMKVRSTKIPKRTKHNGEYIKSLMEAQAMYALETTEEERAEMFAESVKNFVAALKGSVNNGR